MGMGVQGVVGSSGGSRGGLGGGVGEWGVLHRENDGMSPATENITPQKIWSGLLEEMQKWPQKIVLD